MKRIFTLLVTALLILSNTLNAQFALNGTVPMVKYKGLQPDLIEGVSALPATEKPLLRHVYLVDENIVALTIDEQSVILSNFKPYIKEPGDKVVMGSYHGQTKYLVRDGEKTGFLCGVHNSWFRPFNHISGEKLDLSFLTDLSNISVVSTEDSNFSNPVTPVKIHRKTIPIDRTHSSLPQIYPLRHEIYLVLPEKIQSGKEYEIVIKNNDQIRKPVRFIFDEARLRSEAIHLNLAGYGQGDNKSALLSTWMGDGGTLELSEPRHFYIMDLESGKKVFQGVSALKSNGSSDVKSYSQTDIQELDFTPVKKPGQYKLVVEGIGCSFPFEINNAVWENTSRLLMKGFLHQRSGIELGPPYTDYQRPRNMHPADEVTIHMCDVDKFFNPGSTSGGGQQSVFSRIQASILEDTEVPEAWGGWMDAGDFDQRMAHLISVRKMMYLFEIDAEYFTNMGLNIPESENAIPDILDEGAWCLDIYRRTQGTYEPGGVSWWVESIEHPRGGESSWLNSLPTALVPPTPRASLCYAATAAQMSLLTKDFNETLSDEYLVSALDAVSWTDKHPDAPDVFGRSPREIYEALASIQLYRCTGEKKWHKRFEKMVEAIFEHGIIEDVSTGNAEVLLSYLLVKEQKTDDDLRQECEQAILKLADKVIAGAQQNAYNILQHENSELNRMATLSGYILPVMTADWLSGDSKYYNALVQTVQYTMGNNPMNRAYISGLGERFFYPYSIDWEANNMPIPSGIPNFGPISQTESSWGWTGVWAIEAIEGAGLYPEKLITWPHAEKCFNQTWIAPINEFTVRTPMGELLLLSGYLAHKKYIEMKESRPVSVSNNEKAVPGGNGAEGTKKTKNASKADETSSPVPIKSNPNSTKPKTINQ